MTSESIIYALLFALKQYLEEEDADHFKLTAFIRAVEKWTEVKEKEFSRYFPRGVYAAVSGVVFEALLEGIILDCRDNPGYFHFTDEFQEYGLERFRQMSGQEIDWVCDSAHLAIHYYTRAMREDFAQLLAG